MTTFGYSKKSQRWRWVAPAWLVCFLLTHLSIQTQGEDFATIDARRWRQQQLAEITKKLASVSSEEKRLEFLARQTWLRRWKPGEMSVTQTDDSTDVTLVDEPLLAKLQRPQEVSAEAWQQLIAAQNQLVSVDQDDHRKENVRTTIELSKRLETALASELSIESQTLPAPTAWVLAYTRYRLGRALAYRELPEVLESWPITNPDRYQEELVATYRRLTDQTVRVLPEFILLEDRMLRRAGYKGRALELLEENRSHIDFKWYLKKRRDLLQELGWEPAYQEAARRYLEAGFQDEP